MKGLHKPLLGTSLAIVGLASLGLSQLHAVDAAAAARNAVAFANRLSLSGNSPKPILTVKNNGTGTAIRASAPQSPGIVVSSAMNVGMAGYGDNAAGIAGFAHNWYGVFGRSINYTGAAFVSTFRDGVDGVSQDGNGVAGITFNRSRHTIAPAYGVVGSDDDMTGGVINTGVVGQSVNGTGVVGTSVGYRAAIFVNSNDRFAAEYVEGGNPTGVPKKSNPIWVAQYPNFVHQPNCGHIPNSGDDIASIDDFGDLTLCGALTTSAQPLIVTGTSRGRSVVSYGARTAAPTIEDFGEAQLAGGRAYVALENSFASTLDTRAKYLVFITPEGDNRGLYVGDKSARGFSVHEAQGGRSTIAFQWRIVGKPVDSDAARLPDAAAVPEVRGFIESSQRNYAANHAVDAAIFAQLRKDRAQRAAQGQALPQALRPSGSR